ncbi:SRP19 protein [Trypanosoma brucei equiperdum]|uniref:SRP19 protein n=2 Tax=Trypanosoma brucei TaxID=5691 RepID=A0A3L6KX44_9TRYP|nr:signal recognition particle protein SRP19 [Trypanosoma brucei]RHW68899.1 SRP19 protein [Trypanosoma brucei equiperdum]
MKPSQPSYDKRAYQTIYPQYLDAELTPHDGRRLTRTQAVDDPTTKEVVEALKELGYTDIFVEPSASFPRSQGSIKYIMPPKGCVKVAIKRPKGEHYIPKSDFDTQTRGVTVEDIPNKMELLRRVSALIKIQHALKKQAEAAAASQTANTRKK